MRAFYFLAIILVMEVLVGCSPLKPKNIQGTPPQPNVITKSHAQISIPEHTTPFATTEDDENWVPDFQIECAEKKCPKQVGMLAFLVRTENGSIGSRRCTAFLIAPDRIMSNGHCDFSAERVGYFITQRIDGQKIQRKVVGLVHKTHNAAAINLEQGRSGVSGEIDVAVFQLESEISADKITPFTLAQGPGSELEKLYAYVINEGSEPNHFKMELRACELIRHESIFPFSWKENPDVGWSFNCRTQGGNSGSPMLTAPDSLVVEAIHVGSVSLEEQIELTRAAYGREPYIYERHATEHFVNVRCVALPDHPTPDCVRASDVEIRKRFDGHQQSKFAEINERKVPGHEREQFLFTPFSYQQNSVEPDYEFEIFYVPNCRLSPQAPDQVPIKIEQLKLIFDEWARIEFQSVQVRTATAKVLPQSQDDVFVLETVWPAPLSQIHAFAGKDLREQWAKTFNVAIPFCK